MKVKVIEITMGVSEKERKADVSFLKCKNKYSFKRACYNFNREYTLEDWDFLGEVNKFIIEQLKEMNGEK